MTFTQLNYMIAIAEAGSFNKAAERLYVSQPSLTGAVRELEQELGITLFYRSGRGAALTADGEEFLQYARQLFGQYETVLEKYGKNGTRRKKFGVSSQHYSFAVKAFVDMAKQFDMSKYEFAMRETKTMEVIRDVSTQKSEIGILYLCDFNRGTLEKLFRSNNLTFCRLIDCRAYVYLWKHHPLAQEPSLGFDQLVEYPCLAFEQGDSSSFYFAEEILAFNEYPRIIRANDRATMLNLMVGLNGYTLCSGIICEELNGSEFRAVPFRDDEENHNTLMEIGYIIKKNTILSKMGELYIEALKKYLVIG